MKKLLLLACILSLSGCAMFSKTAPVKRTFPDVPAELRQGCPPELKPVPPTEKLSDVLTNVTDNYATYHECRLKVETWTDWYNTQKKIFESVEK